MPILPIKGIKLDYDLAKYAKENNLLHAQLPLKDGSSIHVLDNMDQVLLQNPDLPSKISVYHINGDQIVGLKEFQGSDKGATKFIESLLENLQKFSTSKKSMITQMWDQFFDSMIFHH
jgi:hypothetical protein